MYRYTKKAQGLIEYALMLAFAAVVAVVIIQSLGSEMQNAGDDVADLVGNNANTSDQEWCVNGIGGTWNGDGSCTPPN